MDIHQLKTFVTAEQTLAAHHDLMDEATRIKGHVTGTLRLGAGTNSSNEVVGRLLVELSERCPDVNVTLKHGTSLEILTGVRNGSLDAGFYNEGGELTPELTTIEVSSFAIYLVGSPGLVTRTDPLDWAALAALPWIYPTASGCCGQTAERLFEAKHLRPKRIISVDRQDVTRTLVAGGIGVGLLHEDIAKGAHARGEVDLLFQFPTMVRVLFAHLASRAHDPMLIAATSIIQAAGIEAAP